MRALPLLLLLLVLPRLSVGVASAHGPAPAALSAADPALAVIRTNIGLAFARPSGAFHYVCPSTWESEEQFPEIARLPDGQVVIAFGANAWRLPASGCGREAVALDGQGSASALVAHAGAVYVAQRGVEGSIIWRILPQGPAAEVARTDARIDSMAVTDEGTLLLAAARPEARLFTLDDQALPPLGFEAAFIAIRGDGRFLRVSTDQGIVLLERDAERWIERARAERSVHGPVRFAGGWLAIIDGWLHRREGDAGELSAVEASDWTCLQRIDDAVLACADFGLARVAPDLALDPAFSLDRIGGVDCPDDPATHARCEGEWLHFGAEAGLVRLPPPGGEPAPATTPGSAAAGQGDGCAARPGRGPPLALLLVLLPLALRRRIATLRPTARRGQSRSEHVQVPDSGRDHRRCRPDRL